MATCAGLGRAATADASGPFAEGRGVSVGGDTSMARPSAGVRADDAVGECEHHELGTRLELQFAHDLRAVCVDGADGGEEFRA